MNKRDLDRLDRWSHKFYGWCGALNIIAAFLYMFAWGATGDHNYLLASGGSAALAWLCLALDRE